MLIVIASTNVAIALLCFTLSWRIARWCGQITQLNRNLQRWTVLLENSLAQQTLAFTARRTDLHQWQFMHLRWQLQRRQLRQATKVLQLVWRLSKRQLF